MKKSILFVLVFLVSCFGGRTPKSKFYSLKQIITENIQFETKNKLTIGIGNVNVASYIAKPQIITLKDDIEINISEFNRWAEPLSDSIGSIIAMNLGQYLKNSTVRPIISSTKGFDYIISIDINRLDAKFNDRAYLQAWWTITDINCNIVASEMTVLELPVEDTYYSLVMQESSLINELSLKIAEKIKEINI